MLLHASIWFPQLVAFPYANHFIECTALGKLSGNLQNSGPKLAPINAGEEWFYSWESVVVE